VHHREVRRRLDVRGRRRRDPRDGLAGGGGRGRRGGLRHRAHRLENGEAALEVVDPPGILDPLPRGLIDAVHDLVQRRLVRGRRAGEAAGGSGPRENGEREQEDGGVAS
jgi:hypothetical protein